jgi:disulfide bond formation protein DsbB
MGTRGMLSELELSIKNKYTCGMIDFGYIALATATLATHILIAGLLLLHFFHKKNEALEKIHNFVKTNSLNLIFVSTFTATLGSLFFSEIAKFHPCILCWWQRIFTYPQALLSYVAIMRDEGRLMKPYLLALNLVGVLFSFYHNFILWFPQYAELVSCGTKGGPSCIKGYTFYYGYITIPMMALTVFAFNIILLTLYMTREPSKSKKKLVN